MKTVTVADVEQAIEFLLVVSQNDEDTLKCGPVHPCPSCECKCEHVNMQTCFTDGYGEACLRSTLEMSHAAIQLAITTANEVSFFYERDEDELADRGSLPTELTLLHENAVDPDDFTAGSLINCDLEAAHVLIDGWLPDGWRLGLVSHLPRRLALAMKEYMESPMRQW